jgi:hypothetical protein
MGHLYPETASDQCCHRNQLKIDPQKLEDKVNQEKVVEQLIQRKYVM